MGSARTRQTVAPDLLRNVHEASDLLAGFVKVISLFESINDHSKHHPRGIRTPWIATGRADVTHFNLLQIRADNEKHPCGCAQMFHSGAASTPFTEEQNIYKMQLCLDVCSVDGYGLRPSSTESGVPPSAGLNQPVHAGVLQTAGPGASERRSEQEAPCISSPGFSLFPSLMEPSASGLHASA